METAGGCSFKVAGGFLSLRMNPVLLMSRREPKDRAETPEEDLAATTGFVGFAACRLEDIKFPRVPFAGLIDGTTPDDSSDASPPSRWFVARARWRRVLRFWNALSAWYRSISRDRQIIRSHVIAKARELSYAAVHEAWT
jgi:hypothetical protein